MGELRTIFQKEVLPSLFLNNQDVFYNAFNSGPDSVKALLINCLADVCSRNGYGLQWQQITFNIKYIIIDGSKKNFTCLMIVELPNIGEIDDLAVYAAVFFGMNRGLRLFLGETDYRAKSDRYIWVVELQTEKRDIIRHNHGVLFKGCNNDPLLFEKPLNPQEPDRSQGINPEEELATFADIAAKICLAEALGKFN